MFSKRFYSFLLLVLIIISIFCAGIYTYLFKKNKAFNQTDKNVIVASPTPIESLPQNILLPIIYSPDAEYFITPEIQQQSNASYLISFSLHHRNESIELINDEKVNTGTNDLTLWQSKIPVKFNQLTNDYIKKYKSEKLDTKSPILATWSPSGNKLALYLSDKIVILHLSLTKILKKGENSTYNHHVIKVTKQNDIPTSYDLNLLSNPVIFFSGDESEIYFSSLNSAGNNFKKLDLATLNISTLESDNAYPIPLSKGYVYWGESQSYLEHPLILDTGVNKETYIIKQDFDYAGNIKLSPEKDKVCFDNQASGYSGYAIYNLNPLYIISSGIQYSKCESWIDNDNILVMETPYSFTSYKQYFIYNTRSRQKKFITQYSLFQ